MSEYCVLGKACAAKTSAVVRFGSPLNMKKSGVRWIVYLLRLRLGKGKLNARLSFMVSLSFRHESVRSLCASAAAKGLRFGMVRRWRKFALRNGAFCVS